MSPEDSRPAGPARNRVTPLGDVVSAPGRGSFMGNRGRLHEGAGSRDVRRHHVGRAWITCLLEFRGRRVAQWHPHRYTPLFFLDEPLALAAGHRPCAECRRTDFTRFRDLVAAAHGGEHLSAPDLDRLLHDERWDPGARTRRLHAYAWGDLPDGAFVVVGAGPAKVLGRALHVWQSDNTYAAATLPRPASGTASVVTPPSSLAALRAGYASPSSSIEKA
ncbi:MAG: hypothetical protein ACKOVB_24655 [Terrabacter sp.]